MGKLFWIAGGVGLVAAFGLWVGLTRSASNEVAGLYTKVGTYRNLLHEWATPGPGPKQKFDDIVNQDFLDKEAAYKGELAGARDALLKQMRQKNMDIGPGAFPTPPPTSDVAAFREWLTELCAKRNGKLRAAGIVMPGDPLDLGEVSDWDNVKKEDMPRILREYRVSCEVFRALAEAAAGVHYRAKTLEKDKEATVEADADKKILEIELFRFDEQAAGPRGRGARPTAGAAEKPRLVREHAFTVRFNAHYGPAFDFIRKLEESKAGVFAVRSAEIKRIDRLDIKAEKMEAFANTIGDEAPVAVELKVSLLEFAGQEGG